MKGPAVEVLNHIGCSDASDVDGIACAVARSPRNAAGLLSQPKSLPKLNALTKRAYTRINCETLCFKLPALSIKVT